MRVTFRYIPERPGHELMWPEEWPIPRVGDNIDDQDGEGFVVSTVVWYPHGENGSEPFVYVVLY